MSEQTSYVYVKCLNHKHNLRFVAYQYICTRPNILQQLLHIFLLPLLLLSVVLLQACTYNTHLQHIELQVKPNLSPSFRTEGISSKSSRVKFLFLIQYLRVFKISK
ncbi:Hypothetical predicted protein [Podarcis lilfordi]|uniref:Uncharacterized protein n=1 Tax=Podarcis lilfordi TaxID=74358 RepID=A0AA35PGD6_9SAUR|nr:Hypothetical predicted protein [Podarcis lilfordi]